MPITAPKNEPFIVVPWANQRIARSKLPENWIFAGEYPQCVEFVRKSRDSGAFSKKTVSEWEIIENPAYAKNDDIRKEIEIRIANAEISIEFREKEMKDFPDTKERHEKMIAMKREQIEMLRSILNLDATRLKVEDSNS